MSGKRELLVIGAGGHAREIAWLASRCFGSDVSIRFAVESAYLTESHLSGFPVACLDVIESSIGGDSYVIAIGDPNLRRRIAARLDAAGAVPVNLIDPSVLRSDRVVVGAGSLVCAGTVITCDVSLGRHVHVNTGCLVHHDALIGDYVTLSPGVRLAGHVEIGPRAFLGIGASVVNGKADRRLRIGEGSFVAAGACVTRDVEDGAMVAGVPAVRKK
jgi:sugar O-acyltransferase (sialic acid O-acetyltransferase NeuD family)